MKSSKKYVLFYFIWKKKKKTKLLSEQPKTRHFPLNYGWGADLDQPIACIAKWQVFEYEMACSKEGLQGQFSQ